MESVSIVVPVKDEQDTIHMLVEQIDAVFNKSLVGTATLSDIIFIDDGSSDHTWAAISSATERYPVVKGIRFRRNFGKAAALQEGISRATGGVIVTMDGDLQDDPKEIPRFLEAVRNGADVVSGWKKTRHDPRGKTIPSKLFNLVTAKVSGVNIHDFNCGFKAYRREVFDNIHLYGELHRFVPALAHATGFKVGEIVVEHHPRRFRTVEIWRTPPFEGVPRSSDGCHNYQVQFSSRPSFRWGRFPGWIGRLHDVALSVDCVAGRSGNRRAPAADRFRAVHDCRLSVRAVWHDRRTCGQPTTSRHKRRNNFGDSPGDSAKNGTNDESTVRHAAP